MATTKKKRSFDAARVVEYAEQDTNRGTGRKFGVDGKNCSRSRIVASPYYGMKILVAAASDRANTVFTTKSSRRCQQGKVSLVYAPMTGSWASLPNPPIAVCLFSLNIQVATSTIICFSLS